jgi:hypothetical protein
MTLRAHHSVNSFYDIETPIAVDGTVASIRWANPHVRLKLEVRGENGESELWDIESGGPTLLRRLGVTADVVELGDRVTISGYPSKRRDDEMIGVSIGLPDGSEAPLFPTLAPRFGHELRSGVHITVEDAVAASSEARDIFRVWTVGRGGNEPGPEASFTVAALAGRAAYDPLTEDPALSCIAQGMPVLMDNPFPIQFLDQNSDVLLRFEVWDATRVIHLDEDRAPVGTAATVLGYSVGRWDGDTLVVTTTDIDWPYFDDVGTPQSNEIELTERFTLSEDESRLTYQAVITDPVTLTEPAVRNLHWVWVPGERLESYNCTL